MISTGGVGQQRMEERRKPKLRRHHPPGDARRSFRFLTGLFYVPGNFTPPDEVIEIAKIAGEMGGMHISHMRNESSRDPESGKE